jgi:hypothetical protein
MWRDAKTDPPKEEGEFLGHFSNDTRAVVSYDPSDKIRWLNNDENVESYDEVPLRWHPIPPGWEEAT